MNFQDLYKRIRDLDENSKQDDQYQHRDLDDMSEAEQGTWTIPDEGPDAQDVEQEISDEDKPVEECGMPGMSNMPSGMMGLPKQSDSVTMNVSMNGAGAGGIRNLMDILKDIGSEKSDPTSMVIGMEEYENEPKEVTAGIDAVLQKGNDIHSKGDNEVNKVNGGGNPYSNVDESLVARLSNHYQSIKEAGEKKTMSRAAKGHEKYGKEGMQALAKAGREGKDLDKVREKYNKYD